jgi:hypothetical protein
MELADFFRLSSRIIGFCKDDEERALSAAGRGSLRHSASVRGSEVCKEEHERDELSKKAVKAVHSVAVKRIPLKGARGT